MKKIILLTLVLFMSSLGYSQLTEGFEAAPATPDASGIWSLGSGNWLVRDNRTQGLPNWEVNPSGLYPAYNGTKAAYINRENTGQDVLAEEWLITPQLDIDINSQFRFFTRQTLPGQDGVGTLYQIRVSTDPIQGNLGAYTVLVTYTETELSTITPSQIDYEEKIINLGFSGLRYFAFVKVFTQPGTATGGDRWLIDDVKIVERCAEPTTLGITNVSAYNATFTWISTAPQYTVEYGPSGFVPGTGTIVTGVTGTSYTIPLETTPDGPLTPDTQYQFYVTAICAESQSLITGPFNFTTAPLGSTCDGPIVVTPLPYFDAGNTIQQGNNISFPSPGAAGCGTTGNFLAGNDVVYSYTVPAITTGIISIDMNPLGVSNTGVFVYADCASIGTNCLAGVGNGNANVRNIPSLAVTPGQTIYIVVSSSFQVDDFAYTISIQEVNCTPPSGLSAVGTGPTSANLSWQNPGGATEWEVFVQTVQGGLPAGPGIPASTNTAFSVTEVTGTSAPLAIGTPYQFWVRSDCGNGTFSPWAGPYAFNTTSCAVGCNYTFDMTDTFGDGWNGNTMTITQNGLTIATIGDTFTDGEGPITISVPLCDGPFEIFWNAGGSFAGEVGLSVTNSFNQVIYIKEPGTGTQNSLLFEGVVDCLNPLCLPPTNLVATAVGTNGATLNWVPNGPAPVSWEIFVVPTGQPAPDATTVPNYITALAPPFLIATGLLADTEYEFYVRAICATPGINDWSAPSAPFITLPTCPKPTNLNTLNPTETSITFDWDPGQAETSWQYIAVPTGTTPPPTSDPAWVLTNVHPVTITTGLTSGTAYDFYVVAICTPTDSSTLAGPFTANTTICPPENQCLYTFTMTDSFGDGWNGNTMTILQNDIVVATIGENFTNGNGPIVAQVALCNGFNFEIFWNTGGAFAGEVGLSVTSFLGATIYTKPPGVGQQGTTLFSGTAQCIAPTCLEPTAVTILSTGLDFATIQWTENNTPSSGSWDIIVQDSALPPPAQNATGFINVTTNPYTFQPLVAATSYNVYVRSVCSASDSSFWSEGASFATTACAPSDVCEYTFTMVDTFGDGWNGNTMNIIQGGSVVAVLTGPTNADGQNPVSQVISLCNNVPFELFWNTGGAFAGEVGVSIFNVAGTQIYIKAPGTGVQGTSLFTGTVTCVPATCPKPVQLYAINVTETSATLGWTETGTSTNWEVFIVNAGSPPPGPGAVGIQTTNNPYTATLTSGTAYQFYVRALCSDTDLSNWAGPKNFATLITNDDCDTAIMVPVNGDQSCAQFVSGTVIGATASTIPNGCGGTADDDVWFQFTAVTTAHNISLTNVVGSTQDLFHVLYIGDNCGNLTQVYCSDDNQSIATGLIPGQTYFIRVYSWTGTPGQTSTFDVCIGTIPPPITSSTTAYTATQLVEDILLNSTCASVTNITFSTGTNFGSTNGIGYFDRNGSSFPFDNGVVLTSGDANNAPGPNSTTLSDGDFNWPGDPDLAQILTDQGIVGTTGNATVLEFDFIPLTNNISFDFIFASEEYGVFQCNYSDVFAFLLTDIATGTTTNLAVLPTTNIPVSVTTIRDELYNAACPSANPQYFSAFYQEPEGLNPLAAPINYNGVTVPLTATSPVIAGTQYHIKLAIADFGPFGQDSALDSAVFLKGGSFGIGNIELGDNLLQQNGNAICDGDSVIINSTLDPALYTFVWLQGPDVLPGESGATLTVTEPGAYTVQAQLNNSSCTGTDTITVEYYAPIVPGQADDIVICSATDTGVFDLTTAAPAILTPLGPNFSVSYFTTLEDATDNVVANVIQIPTAYTNTSNPQTIYVRVDSTISDCFSVTTFQLILQDLTPQFTLPVDVSICTGGSQTISVTPINFDLANATYSWTFNNGPLPDTTSSILVTQGGLYEVTVNSAGCTATLGVNVTEVTQITPVFDPIAVICQNATAPILPLTSNDGVTGTWSPAIIDTSILGTTEYCFTPDPSQTCAVQVCINVTVSPAISPTFDPIANLCIGDTAPALLSTSLNGIIGTWLPATIDTSIAGTTQYCFTPDAGIGCFTSFCFDVTVVAPVTPVFTLPSTVCFGDVVPLLPTSSGTITGTWSPTAIDNTLSQVYIFTPDAGQCANSYSINITVLPAVTPTFTQILPFCSGTTPPVLPLVSIDGITGTWNGPVNNQATQTYIFTPNSGQCAVTTTMTITVFPTVAPGFSPITDICVGADAPFLDPTSPTGITGIWNPSTVSTATAGTTTYTFTPDNNGQCSAVQSLTVTVIAQPDFTIQQGCNGSDYVLTAIPMGNFSDDAIFEWSDSAGNTFPSEGPILIVTATGNYYLAVSQGNCAASKEAVVEAISCGIQKGISPGDGNDNDFFDLSGQNVRQLEIFNRYGTKVYSQVNYSREWYGQSDKGDELPDGTYFYVIERDNVATKTGWIYINRVK